MFGLQFGEGGRVFMKGQEGMEGVAQLRLELIRRCLCRVRLITSKPEQLAHRLGDHGLRGRLHLAQGRLERVECGCLYLAVVSRLFHVLASKADVIRDLRLIIGSLAGYCRGRRLAGMRDVQREIIVRRSYRSGFQRNAIRKALRSRFETLKARQPRLGRGSFRSDIFGALSRHADAIRYTDGVQLLFGEDAITDSDLRDALSPTADLTKTWETNDQKVRIYDAYLQIVDESFPSIADLSRRYEAALEVLQTRQGYLAENWQAHGAALIAADIASYWTGSLELEAISLPGSEEYACGFDVLEGRRFDGKRAKMTVLTRYSKLRTGYAPNTILAFGAPVAGGYRPASVFIFPLKGLFRDERAVAMFRNLMAMIGNRDRNAVQMDLEFPFLEILRAHEPIVLSGMAAPGFTGLGESFTGPRVWKLDPTAYMRGERIAAEGDAFDLNRFRWALSSIDQSVQVHLDLALFGISTPFDEVISMRLAANTFPLINNIFFDFPGGPISMCPARGPDRSEQVGRPFDPPSLMPMDTDQLPEAVRLVLGIAAEFSLWMPEETMPE